MNRPHVDTLKGSRHSNMKELRFNAGDGCGVSCLLSIRIRKLSSFAGATNPVPGGTREGTYLNIGQLKQNTVLCLHCLKLRYVPLRTYPCTHYAALIHVIQNNSPEGVDILTQAQPVEERLDWLQRHPEFEQCLSKTGARRLLTTDDHVHFSQVAHSMLGTEIEAETIAC